MGRLLFCRDIFIQVDWRWGVGDHHGLGFVGFDHLNFGIIHIQCDPMS